MSAVLIGVAAIVLTVSGTALGFGIACVVDGDGDGDAGCALLVLAPVIAGFPLGVALAIFGAAGCGWLGRRGPEEEEEKEDEGNEAPRSRPLDPSTSLGTGSARGERGAAARDERGVGSAVSHG